MKITIIGSTQYESKMQDHAYALLSKGHEVKLPALDHHPDKDVIGVCEYNRDIIEWADEVHLIWDNRSTGSIFDFGQVFALRKAFKIIYIETKTFQGLMEAYAEKSTKSVLYKKPMNDCPTYSLKCPYALSEGLPVPCVGNQEQCNTYREKNAAH